MRNDCGDVRFVDGNGNLLPYTLENSTCNSANTIFWVWANLTASSSTDIYAYYNNPDATLPLDYISPDSSLDLLMHFDNDTLFGEGVSLVYDYTGNNFYGTPAGNAKTVYPDILAVPITWMAQVTT
jgi:hypothetical protein